MSLGAQASPDAKRALLARLLQKRLEKIAPILAEPSENGDRLERFAIPASEMAAEAVPDPQVRFDAPLAERSSSEPAHVLLTGATGFLGAFLVAELLKQTDAVIHCLVRCSDIEQGRERIYKALEAFLPDVPRTPRIVPVPGDLSKPLFGLSRPVFERLASDVDAVYHNGAMVHGLYSYKQLKPTNVQGTQEAIRLAALHRRKPLHYVSTVAACPMEDSFDSKVVSEVPLDEDGLLYGGYSQSKWVAEQLVIAARDRGLPVTIYRPGIITGHSDTGAWSTSDATCRIIKAAVDSGLIPDVEGAMDMTPVDYVSRAIAHLSTAGGSLGQIYHLANPRPVTGDDLVRWVRTCGYPLRRVPYEEWRTEMVTLANRSDRNPLAAFAPLFSTVVSDKLPAWMMSGMMSTYQAGVDRVIKAIGARYGAQSVRLDCENAVRDLAGTGIVCPAVDDRLLNTYFAYFVRIGYLSEPTH